VGDTGYKGAMSSLQDSDEAKAVKQSLAGVDLGSESYAEALMDPSHPSAYLTPSLLSFFPPIHLGGRAMILKACSVAGGPWGTWVEPSTSARSVIGEKQFEADTSSLAGGARNTQRRIQKGEAAIAAAVAKSNRVGFGLPGSSSGLGGRYAGPNGASQADGAESYAFGRLLDTSTA
jgi:hypothetical protein